MNPILQVLNTKDFKKLWFIGTTGMAMRWIETIALGFYVYSSTKDEFLVGLVFFFRMAPMLFFGAFIGVISDQYNKKTILKFTLLITSIIYFLLSISAYFGTLDYNQICIGAFVAGLAWSFDFPTRRSMLSEIVDKSLYSSAIGLDMASSNMARIIGPIIAGIVLLRVDLFPIYIFGAFLFFIAYITCIKITEPAKIINSSKSLSLLKDDLFEGVKFIFKSKILITVLVVTIIMNSFVFTYTTQLAVLVLENLSGTSVILGILAGVEGLGATIGTLLIANFPIKKNLPVFLMGSFLFGFCILAFTYTQSIIFALVLMLIGGIGMSGFGTMQSILIISSAKREIRGRILGILALTIGTQPLGAFLLGYFSREFGSINAVKISLVFAIFALIIVTILQLKKN
ncbi:MAG: MFS transporter [Dehalococcoidales bacterium]|nr:MFS transporter [Dehalococcoidales bacterium]